MTDVNEGTSHSSISLSILFFAARERADPFLSVSSAILSLTSRFGWQRYKRGALEFFGTKLKRTQPSCLRFAITVSSKMQFVASRVLISVFPNKETQLNTTGVFTALIA